MSLPTDRSSANTVGEHISDHNALHAHYNQNIWAIGMGGNRMLTGGGANESTFEVPAARLPNSGSPFAAVGWVAFPPGWTRVAVDVILQPNFATSGTRVRLSPFWQRLEHESPSEASTTLDPVVIPVTSPRFSVAEVMKDVRVNPGRTNIYRFGVTRTPSHPDDDTSQEVNVVSFRFRKIDDRLPTNRNIGNTGREHLEDHNALHTLFNEQLIFVTPGSMELADNASWTGTGIVFPFNVKSGAVVPVKLPSHWETAKLTVFLSPGTDGFVHMRFYDRPIRAGVAPPATALKFQSAVEVTNGTQLMFSFNDYTVPAHDVLFVRVERDGSQINDTGTGPITFRGLILEKVS